MIVKLSKKQNIQVLQQVTNDASKEKINKLYQNNQVEHELFEFDDKLLTKATNYDLAITRLELLQFQS